jgi:hypothetical protein
METAYFELLNTIRIVFKSTFRQIFLDVLGANIGFLPEKKVVF